MTTPTDPTLTHEAIVALGAAQLRTSVERPTPSLRERIREHAASEPCPPRSVDDRSWPLSIAPRALLELIARPGTEQFGPLLNLIEQLLQLRLARLMADLEQLTALVQRHRAEPAGITPATLRAEALAELRRSLSYRADLAAALAELEVNGATLEGVLTGQRCPTCLASPVEGCKSGWIRQIDGSALECPTRAEKNGRDPQVWKP